MKSRSYPAVSKLPLSTFAVALLGLLALGSCGAFIFAAVVRLRYPFELDLIEGGMFEQVRHVARGSALYAPPSFDFIPFIYGPLYTYLAALTGRLFGYGFENLRYLSIGASLASCAAIALIVNRSTGTRLWGLFAAALYLATYAAAGFSFDQGRVDSLFLALLLWGYYFLRFGSDTCGILLSALFFALAFFTKQIAIIPLLCLLPLAKRRGRKPFVIFGAATAVVCSVGILAINWLTDGWYYYYCFNLPAQHDIRVAYYRYFWLSDIGLVLPIATALSLYCLVLQKKNSNEDSFVANFCFLIGFLLLSWVSRLHSGGIENVLAPAYAALSICALTSLSELKNKALGYALLCAQFLTLMYPPTAAIPSSDDATAGRLVLRVVSAYPGPVFVPYHPYLLTLADKGSHAHHWALYDVLRGDPKGEGARLRRELEAALAAQKFSAVLSDDDWFKQEIEAYYQFHTNIFNDERVFRPVFGETRARPEFLYEPRILIPSSLN